jgi:hypothetical protein
MIIGILLSVLPSKVQSVDLLPNEMVRFFRCKWVGIFSVILKNHFEGALSIEGATSLLTS